MNRNTDSRNLCPTWDLSDAEREKFYRGAGAATVVLDTDGGIVECHYFALGPLPDDDDEQQTYIKTAFPTAARQMDGMMSCGQFCEVAVLFAPDDGPDELPDALIDALGVEAQRRRMLNELLLSGEDAAPELEDLMADDELAELTPEEEAAVQHDVRIWEESHAPDIEP
jgi:hypothetical protein